MRHVVPPHSLSLPGPPFHRSTHVHSFVPLTFRSSTTPKSTTRKLRYRTWSPSTLRPLLVQREPLTSISFPTSTDHDWITNDTVPPTRSTISYCDLLRSDSFEERVHGTLLPNCLCVPRSRPTTRLLSLRRSILFRYPFHFA